MRKSAIGAALTLTAALLAPATSAAQTPVLCDGIPATIVGTAGDDFLTGTPGDDVIFAAQGNDTIDGLAGDDVICAGKGNDRVAGGDGFDIIFGAQGDDVLWSGGRIAAPTTNDTRGARMFGGLGDDTIHGSNRWDRMQGGPGKDQLHGYEGRDWIRGGPDRDEIYGGLARDDLHGGNGSDRITVTNGDTVRGGAGNDLCLVTGVAALFVSCGANSYEAPTPHPRVDPFAVTSARAEVGIDIAPGRYRLSPTAQNPTITFELLDARGGRIEFVQTNSVFEFNVAAEVAFVEFDGRLEPLS